MFLTVAENVTEIAKKREKVGIMKHILHKDILESILVKMSNNLAMKPAIKYNKSCNLFVWCVQLLY